MFRSAVILAFTMGMVAPALADHLITVTNRCPQTITPAFTNTGGPFVKLNPLGQNGVATHSVPENWLSGRVFGQTGQCAEPDGGGCTLVECDFSVPGFHQCNLSRVDGFNVGVSFSYDDPSCGGNTCPNPNCPPDQAFSTPTNGGNSIRQCNTAGVGLHVTFCP